MSALFQTQTLSNTTPSANECHSTAPQEQGVISPRARAETSVQHEALAISKSSKWRIAIIIISVTCSTFISALVNGMVTVSLPAIARDVNLNQSLILWPQSILSVVSACTLLLCGSLADVFGGKAIYVLGSALQGIFILAAGFAQSGTQLLAMRATLGLAQSMCLPSSISVITSTFPSGRSRNIAFSCMGGGQPVGFALGLVLGGVFTDTVGWRTGMWTAAGVNAIVVVMAAFGLEQNARLVGQVRWIALRRNIDWIGICIASTCLALLCLALAFTTTNVRNIKKPWVIILFCLSIALIPAFLLWMHIQTAKGKPALIPNSLWRGRVFSGICASVVLAWGFFYATEQVISLWLQLVQSNSALSASLKLLPATVTGVIVNAFVGAFVHRMNGRVLVVAASILSFTSPLIMALCDPQWVYWAAVFPAISLIVIGPDTLYTVSNILITKEFPDDAQGLAGGVFNTAAQVGKTLGLALSGVIVAVTENVDENGDAINQLESYRAGFWLCVSLAGLTVAVSFLSLRHIGRIGNKDCI